MSDPFAAMTESLLARLGEPATIRGDTPAVVIIERGILTTDTLGDVALPRTVATISRDVTPVMGDTLVLAHTGEHFRLDALMSDDGYSATFVLV